MDFGSKVDLGVANCAPLNCVGEEGCFGFGDDRLGLVEDVKVVLF